MNINRKEKMRFYNCLTGKKYFPNWGKSISQLGTNVLRTLLIVMMMVMGVNVWGQTPDYSGTYYIGSNAYDGNPANTNNYYLCPTEGWAFFVSEGTPYCTVQGPDNGQPFLTTYQIKKTGYDRTKAKWTITKIANSEYYYIQQTLTKKYLVVNGAVSSNPDRARIHLEDISENDLDERAQFAIYLYSGHIVIKSISIDEKQSDVPSGSTHFGTHDDHKWLTVNQGNKPNLNGTNAKTDGPSGFPNTGGIIGIFTESDAKGDFYLEDYITRPTITYNSSNLIEITPAQTGTVTIKYTTDGSTPSTSNGVTYSAPFDPDDDVTTIKAIVIVNGEESNVATFKPIVLLGSSHKRLIQNQGDPWNETDFHFYMIPGDEVEGITKVNTTSLFRPSMEWYFLNAGVESDIQYYYIVNNVNGKSLCYDETNIVYMANNDNSNKFKFSIAEPTTAGTYNIIPYGVTKKFIQKDGGNGSVNPVYLKSESYNTSNNQYARWKFILPTELDRNAPFTASDPTNLDYHYFTITTSTTNNNVATTYYLAPGTANVQTLTSSDASALWYFEVVQAADATDWLTYYHIRNAVTGDYLYFDIDSYNTNTTSSCFKTSTTIEGNAERYKFTWAKTASASVNYYIVPKLMKDASQNTISTLYRNNNTNIRLDQTRSTGTRVWNFESTTYNCAQPEITWSDSDNGYIITASESDANIYYTIGDGELTPSTGTPYTVAISVAELSGTMATIRAIAARNSDGSDASTVASVTVSKVATPTFTLSDGKVQISCTTAGASIYYEIGNTADGVSTPTSSSTPYSVPIENAEGKYIKAIAVKGGLINSAVAASSQILFPCATPVIRKTSATTFTIECSFPTSGVTIYYTKGANPADPTTSSTQYNGVVSFTASELPFTVKAIAVASNYENSEIATLEITEGLTLDDDDYYIIASDDDFKKFITMANGAEPDKNYKITDDIDATGTSAVSTAFTGELMGVAKADGTFPVISNLGHPIFNTINGGTVKNIMLNKVSISQAGNVGAIAGVASGYTRIYNCGILPTNATNSSPSTVASTDGYCGGLVGWLKDDSRVINCFSYANITGGTDVAGIVGHNEIASTTEVTDNKYANLRTAVVNCMFYGKITGGTNRYPVYGGEKMVNNTETGINNYDFYRAEAPVGTLSDYNCSWPASEENLTRFEYYRYLLNSNRELCGWWVKSDVAPSTMNASDVQAIDKDASLMAKWVLDPALAPYPILKSAGKYPSVINPDPDQRIAPDTKKWVSRTASENTIQTNAAPDIEGETLGTISVTINAGIHHSGSKSRDITITAMDIDNNDFCYGKIQLPYYNDVFGKSDGSTWSEKYGDNYTGMVVTGWDITTSEGKTGTFSDDPITGYNFADRNCTAKDTHRVFAQGGFYYVPYGVTSITLTAHWAKAYYLSNTGGNYDRVYFSESNANTTSAGHPFAPAGTRSFENSAFGGQTINSGTITSILSNTSKENSVYDCAIVLVSNYQYRNNLENIADGNRKPFTLMTVDLDFDNEPDYCFEWQFGGGPQGVTRAYINPVRFDFLPIVELGIAMKEDNSKYLFAIGKVTPYGHFETTETALIHMGQFEYDDKNRNVLGPVILNNGTFDQICRGSESDDDQNVNYFILGGHVKLPSFTPGSHVRKAAKSRHCAVNVLGGEITYFYLSGNYIADPTNEGDPHGYIDGGKLDFVASGAKEKIVGNVFWEIDHSCIGDFYGGGINAAKPVQGDISTTINRSRVTKFCGGPQFGNMESGKTVTTNATGTTFGVFYGAGNGGTCYSQYDQSDNTSNSPNSFNWETNNTNSGKLANYTALNYRSSNPQGYHAKYELEMINSSAGTMNNAVCRTYMYVAEFATTNTGAVESTLTDCTVNGNFFGGGLLGGVTGDVTSTLKGHTIVNGSVYGGGYGIADLTVDIFPKEYTAPTRNENTAVITAPVYPAPTTYYWIHDTSMNTGNNKTKTVDGKNYLYTTKSLDNLGTISGDVILNIEGDTEVHGDVFGGGDKGLVTGTATVNIDYEEPTP